MKTIVLKSIRFLPEYRVENSIFLSYEKWLPLTMAGMYLTVPDRCVERILVHCMNKGNRIINN